MKLIHIVECAGGVERYLQIITPLFKDKGIKQILICSQHFTTSNFDGKVEKTYQIQMEQSFCPFKVVKMVHSIHKILKYEQPDIIYCHSSFGGVIGRLASIGSNIKVIYNAHGWAFNMKIGLLKLLVYILIERFLALLTDKIICISSFERESALKYHIAKKNKLITIFNGIDVSLTTKQTLKYHDIPNIPSSSYTIGMVGRISEQKAPDIFVKMAILVKKKIPNAYFIIVGDGEMRITIESMIKAVGLENSFFITNWVDNPYPYISRFDIGVLLSRWEGFGLAIAEYMICKKPIVSTKVGGIMDIVKDGFNGLLINEINEKCAAAAVFKLYNNKSLANRLANNAYNFALKELNITRTAAEHYSLFKSLQNHVQ